MHRPTSFLALSSFLVGVALIAVACGGGDNAPTAGDAFQLGAAAYRDEANAICAKAYAKGRLPPDWSTTGTVSFDRNFGSVVELRGRALRDLRGLTPPPADAATVARMLRYLTTGQLLLLRAVRLGRNGALGPSMVAAARADRNNPKGWALARGLGLNNCALL
jgi:hypothetical protein